MNVKISKSDPVILIVIVCVSPSNDSIILYNRGSEIIILPFTISPPEICFIISLLSIKISSSALPVATILTCFALYSKIIFPVSEINSVSYTHLTLPTTPYV